MRAFLNVDKSFFKLDYTYRIYPAVAIQKKESDTMTGLPIGRRGILQNSVSTLYLTGLPLLEIEAGSVVHKYTGYCVSNETNPNSIVVIFREYSEIEPVLLPATTKIEWDSE